MSETLPAPVQTRSEPLSKAMLDIVRRPVSTLVAAWNWKAAAISAAIRASFFFTGNLKAGHNSALEAALVEACFAIIAAGIMAAVTQRLRDTQPVWATALVVWLGMPLLLLCAQTTVHNVFGTPHMKAALIASFCFASIASGFNWFAQRRGVLLAGPAESSVTGDLKQLPKVVLDFVLAGPRALLRSARE